MNPHLTVTNASSSPQIQNPKSKIQNVIRVSSGHKRNGKIAHLPKSVRDKINHWLDDGRTYPQIIKDLSDDAKDLKPNHFSEWRKGGYQDYLHQQDWRDDLRLLRENGSDINEFTDSPKFQETLVQLALTEIFRTLRNRELKSDSLNYIRLFNALARLNREALGLRKYNDHLATQPAKLKQLDPNLDPEKIRNIMLSAMEQAMGVPASPTPIGPALNLNHTPTPALTPTPNLDPSSSSSNSESATTHEGPTSESDQPQAEQLSCELQTPKPKIEIPQPPFPSRNTQHATRPQPEHPESSAPVTHRESRITSSIPENCLECSNPLPPLLSSGGRASYFCPHCDVPLPPPGDCREPSIEQCPECSAHLPRLRSNGQRPLEHCHRCGFRLPNPKLEIP